MNREQEKRKNVYKGIKKRIEKAINLILFDRAYVFILRGPHNSGKTQILNQLKSEFKEKMVILNYNDLYSNHSIEKKEKEELVNHPLKFLREIMAHYGKSYDVLALDHLERYYNSLNSIEPLITTLIHQSRHIYVNKHHLIIIVTMPTSQALEKLNNSFADLGNQLNAINIFTIKKKINIKIS